MGVNINNFIINSDFTSEKITNMEPITITVSINSGSKASRTVIGYSNYTVDSGKYMINSIHTNNNNSNSFCGVYGDYITGNSDGGPDYPYWVFGELIQTSNTNIMLRVWGDSSGGYNFTMPQLTVTVKLSLSILPINF